MQFLVISRRLSERFAPEDFVAIVPEEAARARELYSQGFTRQIWHRADRQGACQIIEADSEEHAHRTLATLPLAKAGMLEFTILQLAPYAGFCPTN